MLEFACRTIRVPINPDIVSRGLSYALAVALLLTPLAAFAQTKHNAPRPEIRTGIYKGQPVRFQVINGWAVVDGDIILGRADALEAGSGASRRARAHAVTIPPVTSSLWPKVGAVYQVPYVNDTANPVAEQAVKMFNATFPGVIQYVPRSSEPDYVEFNLTATSDGVCSSQSNVGRVGGAQQISGSVDPTVPACTLVIMHEMGHSVGLYHEQERSDSSMFVQIQWNNIPANQRSQYYPDKGAQSLGLYDIGSAMHYNYNTFSIDSTDASLISLPIGVPFKDGGGYSAGDIDAINRLYGAAPTQVTITSDPPGLQLTVDGQAVTTGTPAATFAWNMGSQHVLDVPNNLQTQTLNGNSYSFARWNDIPYGAVTQHTITITPGDGSSPAYPPASPMYTTYTAEFQLLVPAAITTGVSPANSGQVNVTPGPMAIQGGSYYYNLQPLQATATPAAGFAFYDWQYDGQTPAISGLNPKTVRPGISQNVVARFAQNPVTTILTSPSGLPVTVDGTQYYSPKNFAQDYDAAWTAGSSHTISVNSPLPSNVTDPDARLMFTGWSDGGAQSHNVTAGDPAVYVANFATQYQLTTGQSGMTDSSGNPCTAATITTNPASADGYYNGGAPVSVTVQPNAGWTFVGWQGAVTDSSNPAMLTMDVSKNLNAVLNTVNAPLTVTGLIPSTAALNGQAFTLTINGKGFTPSTLVCPASGANCVQTTYQSQYQIQAQITPDLLTTAGPLGLLISNSGDGQCNVTATTQVMVQ